jgi:uncharacterized protein (UPF0335 family)
MARRKKEQTEERPNDLAAKAMPFIDRIEYLDAEMSRYRAEIAESKKIVLEEAEAAGIQPKALRMILVERKFRRRQAEQLEKQDDIDVRAQFAALEALAEAFGDSPMGDFARSMANLTRDGATVSVHLATADQREAADGLDAMEREDEAHLQNMGRGKPAEAERL